MKKLRLALPKTRRRKSLLNAFSDSASEVRQDSVNEDNVDLVPEDEDSVQDQYHAAEEHVKSSPVKSQSISNDNIRTNTANLSYEEDTVNYSEKSLNPKSESKASEQPNCVGRSSSYRAKIRRMQLLFLRKNLR